MLGRLLVLIAMATAVSALLWSSSSSMYFQRFAVAFGFESGENCFLHHRRSSVVHHTPSGSYDVTLHVHRMAAERPTADMPNITLVSHATIDRLPHVARWCRTLRGPMSISVFVRPVVDDVAAVMGAFAADECIARHADLHLVTERGHAYNASAASGADGKDMMTHYPFNVQRNAALDGCVGALALLMDIDFHLMPVPNNREVDLRRHLEEQRAKVAAWPFLADEPWVLDAAMYVIPAVETVVKELPLPTSVSELRAQHATNQAVPFYGHYCKFCHRPTDLKRFLQTSDPYLVEYVEGYEPYVVVNKTGLALGMLHLPRYDELFVGRGYDKMSFFYELFAQQRPFVVVPDYFVAHSGRGDLPSFFKPQSAEYRERQAVNRALMDRFMIQTRDRYRYALRITTAAVTPSRPTMQSVAEVDATPSPTAASVGGAEGSHEQVDCLGGERPSRLVPSTAKLDVSQQRPSEGEDVVYNTPGGGNTAAAAEYDDKLLWEATRLMDWQLYASSAGFPVVCTVDATKKDAFRQAAEVAAAEANANVGEDGEGCDAALPCDLSTVERPAADANASSSTRGCCFREKPVEAVTWEEQLRRGIWWACARMNCDGLLERNCSTGHHHASFALHRDGTVTSPRVMDVLASLQEPHLTADAMWVYDRWFHLSVAAGSNGYETCSFSGTATLVERTMNLVGCTVDPRRELPVARLETTLTALCTNVSGRLGSVRCQHLKTRMHPLLRSSARLQLSVALNAHHLMYEGGETGSTCERLFPGIAVRTPWAKLNAFRPVASSNSAADVDPEGRRPARGTTTGVDDNDGDDESDRYLTVADPVLVRATAELDWDAVASNGRGIFPPPPLDPQLQVAEGRTCIASFRLPLQDPHYNRTAHLSELLTAERAMDWTCGRMNCGNLQVDRATGALLRHYPRNIVVQADWIFGRWFYDALLSGETVSQACYFGGAARLAHVTAFVQDMPKDIVGCTINPEHPTTRTQLIGLVQEICNDPPPVVLPKDTVDDVGKSEDGAAVDRIGGRCQALFSRIDRMVADDWHVKASVALNAHHLIFFAGGEGLTCRRRFGNVAAYLRV